MMLMVGTTKGLFRYRSSDRCRWQAMGPVLIGDPVYTSTYVSSTQTLYAGANSVFYGPSVRRSQDWGETWDLGGEGLQYDPGDGEQVTRVWAICSGSEDGQRLYAGVEASGLFRSDDGGGHWVEVRSLRAHATHDLWEAGAGGKCLHTILVDPRSQQRLYIACSAGGVYRSTDAGETWQPINHGIRAEFMPEGQQYPVAGQCVHKVALTPSQEGRMWLQNHGGVYRSDDGGDSWVDVGGGLPVDFGFPIVAHPTNPDRAYVIPLTDPPERWMPNQQMSVYATDDAGGHWHRCDGGLPRPTYEGVLRDAFATDAESPLGLYFGTTVGAVYGSFDEGKHWHSIAEHLPRVLSVVAVQEP